MSGDPIVEVYSAADATEAYAVVAVLEREGVEARVVGDALSGAAGALPFGQTIAPRIWVRQEDQQRARRIVTEWEEGRRALQLRPEDEQSEEAPDEAEEVEAEPSASDGQVTVVGKLLALLAAACFLTATWFAWQSYVLVYQWDRAEGVYAGWSFGTVEGSPIRPTYDLPVHPRDTFSFGVNFYYVYSVDGVAYEAVFEGHREPPGQIIVHYNPHQPEEYVIGPVTSPWLWLFLGAVAAGFLLLVAYQFR